MKGSLVIAKIAWPVFCCVPAPLPYMVPGTKEPSKYSANWLGSTPETEKTTVSGKPETRTKDYKIILKKRKYFDWGGASEIHCVEE